MILSLPIFYFFLSCSFVGFVAISFFYSCFFGFFRGYNSNYMRMTESGSIVAARHEGTMVATVYGITVRKNRVAT